MKRVLSGILVFVLLAVTVGVPISRHTCYVFDKTELSLLTQKQFCDPGDSQSEAAIDFKCCSLEQFDTALSYETLIDKSTVKIINLEVILPQMLMGNLRVVKTVKQLPDSRPPPVANRDLLNKYQVYLI